MTDQPAEQWAETWGVPADAAPRIIARLRGALTHRFGLAVPPPLWTPATAGLALLESTNAGGCGMTALPEEERRQIVGTTCQHRVELFPHADDLPAFHYYDGRAMYVGLCDQEIGCGPVRRLCGGDIYGSDRGRYHVSVRVPAAWRYVGLLGVPDPVSNRWVWPSTPGAEFDTWADCCEVRFAVSQGWHIEVREKLLLTGTGRPLRDWAGRLATLYRWSLQEQDGALMASCYRAICLHTIGALHSQRADNLRTVFVAGEDVATIPDGVDVEMVEGGYQVTSGQGTPRHWQPKLSHPEWSAAIWSLCHLRIAKALLSVPLQTVLGVRGDAIYMTDDPQWTDDGKLGRLRCKGTLPGPLPAPRSWRDLTALARRSEEAHGAR